MKYITDVINNEIKITAKPELNEVIDFIRNCSNSDKNELIYALNMQITIEDVLEHIYNRRFYYDHERIYDALKLEAPRLFEKEEYSDEFITFDNLLDREKVLLLKKLFEKLSIDELEELVK